MLLGRPFRNKSPKEMAFPHPKSGNDHDRNEDLPNNRRVLRDFCERTIDIAENRNAKDDVNPAKNHSYDALAHGQFSPPLYGVA